MKIYVVSRTYVRKQMFKDPNWYKDKWVISIFSTPVCCPMSAFSPFPNASNVLKLQFDDVTERDTDPSLTHFSPTQAEQIKEFVSKITDDGSRDIWVHCDAGVSRSGAVGYVLNEYFNKFLTVNKVDQNFFETENCIMPNSEVARLLKNALFGTDYSMVFTDHDFNEDAELILKEITI